MSINKKLKNEVILKLIFVGYSYDHIGPHFIFYNTYLKNYKKQYLNNISFTIKKVEKRYCIGIYNLDTLSYSPCPNNYKLDFNSKINNCDECYNKIGFNPAFYNTQKISPQQLEYNKLPHVVYLAYFSPLHIKVGIASAKRSSLRLLEQGARAAFIIKTFSNAYLARELEAKLCKGDYGILERLSSDQKLNIIFENSYDPITANKTLSDILMQVNIVPESEFLDFNLKYFYNNNYDLSNLEKVKKPEFLSGQAIGMIGDIAILKQKEKIIAVSVKKFISHKIDINYSENFMEYLTEPKQISFW